MKIDLRASKFVVIGSGDTGKSIIQYLRYHGSNILRILDTRDNPPPVDGLNVIGGALKYENIADSDVIVVSPGVSIYEPILQKAICNGKKIVGDIELFAQAIESWRSRVIAITGSNGKTTVTSLTGFIAEKLGYNTLVAGNIGTPVLSAWLEIEQSNNRPEVIVLELSSFQLETTYSLVPDSATVLNISEDHLDRYRDLLEYAYVKAHIFNKCTTQVLNADDKLVLAMSRSNSQKVYFAENDTDYCLVDINGETFLQVCGNHILNTKDLNIVGRHNYLNILSSIALLNAAGIELNDGMLDAVKEFAGLEHRMQKVAEYNGILFIEDSKGTNVGAVIAGVGGIDRPVHLILGGDGKGQDFTPLRELVLRKCKSVALIGQDSSIIADVLSSIDNVSKHASLQDAIKECINLAVSGDAIILSPACASWDMFKNYKERAEVFVDTVNEIYQ